MTDLNLLATLNVLLAENSVAGAARRLELSSSAMSRALTRLREVTGDPLLVRAGRRLVPTPRATQMRDEVAALVDSANALLRPAEKLDVSRVSRRFILRCSEGFVETFGPRLLTRIATEAPGITLQFVTKLDKDSAPLRQGEADFETGVVDKKTAPELITRPLFHDHWIAAVRKGHPLASTRMRARLLSEGQHVVVARRGLQDDDIEAAFQQMGVQRRIATVVNGFSAALALARNSDLIATVPARHTEGLRAGMQEVNLPVRLRPFHISLLWHPRMNGDLAHRWLREALRTVCTLR